jgi:NADPH:quinone reductase-like Zn-dependent oxidoreductase
VVLELIGASSLERVLGSLATEARVVVIGVGGGGRIELDLLGLMGRRASIGAATLRARDHHAKEAVARALADHGLPLLASGALHVPIFATYPMAEAEAAYAAFAAGGKFGKIVLVS